MVPGLSYSELMVFGIIALLLFGKKLPEVARSLGKSMVEFKKGMRGIEEELRSVVSDTPTTKKPPAPSHRPEPKDDRQTWTAPRFDPPTAEPQA